MANLDAAAVLRGDINTIVQEAAQADSMFIGSQVFPPQPSPVQDGQYPKFKLAKGELLDSNATERQPTGSYGRITRTYESATFSCVDRGVEELVDDTYRANVARFFDAEVIAAKQCLRSVQMAHEVRVSAALMNNSNFTATAAAVNYTEANLATINFPKDVLDAVDRLNAKGSVPNTIVMSNALANRIKRSTLFQNFVRGNLPSGQPVVLTNSDIQRGFADLGITNVLVGCISRNTAKKGQAFSGSPVWGNTYIWVGNVAGGDFMNGGAGRTIVWNAEGGIFVSETYRDETRRSNVVRVRQNTAESVVDGSAGELITTSYS